MSNELHSFYSDELISQIHPPPQLIQHLPIKRSFDIAFSLFVLIAFSPLFLLIALLIRLSSKGCALYAQERIGRGGIPFRCYKFRTMYANADAKLQHLLDNDNFLRTEWEKRRKLKKDPRITPIGRILRKTSLDELPQFWNVLKGDLSVVGPRPVVKEELDTFYGYKTDKILSIRPGLTGIWQTSGRNDTDYVKRIAMDEYYIENHSLWLDLKLILKTVPSMITTRGAY